jgi:hypothetical protein
MKEISMNKATRTLAMTGLALTAGAAFAGTPAMASPATPAGPAASAAVGAKAQTPRRDRVVGFYRTLRACDLVGRRGEFRDRWDDYDCTRVRVGMRRGSWALLAHWGGHRSHGGGWGHR